jgi:hypothetical protein
LSDREYEEYGSNSSTIEMVDKNVIFPVGVFSIEPALVLAVVKARFSGQYNLLDCPLWYVEAVADSAKFCLAPLIIVHTA